MKLPEEFCERMKALVGDEYDDFLKSYDNMINKGIRINTLKCTDTRAMATTLGAEEPVLWCKDGFYLGENGVSGNHPYHGAGVFYFQEPSAMCVAEGLPFSTCLYETASAIGTVGLTLGLTPGLGLISRTILIILMFFGRVGGLTLIFAAVSEKGNHGVRLPQEKITVG